MSKTAKRIVRSAYMRTPLRLTTTQESKTHQSMAADCNINTIMDRYNQTGQIEQLRPGEPAYGDFSDTADYHTSMNLIIDAQEQFARLPAKIRERMGNDPGALLDFVNDPGNQEEGEELGLFARTAKTVPTPPENTTPPPKTEEVKPPTEG